MIYRIFEQDANTLLEMPETGMGYQIVYATQYERYNEKQLVVYNTNLAVELDSEFDTNRRRIVTEGYNVMLNKVSEIMLETPSIRVLAKSEVKGKGILTTSKKEKYKRYIGKSGAIDNPKEKANGREIFVRLSAFEDDRRVDFINRKLKPGSFATTNYDYLDCVSTGDDPVDRYALPNDDKIEWAFFVRPERNDTLQRGIVQPAFGHDGGGIEVFFEKGTSKNTLLGKVVYGEPPFIKIV